MADIGYLLHWNIADLEAMPWERLMQYHSLAMDRFKTTAALHGAEVKT